MNDGDFYVKLRKQIEYYLSDDNLQNDGFFHAKLSQAGDAGVPLEVFLNCNKVKRMGATLDKIRKALEASATVKVTEDGNGVRRVLQKLPPLRTKQLLLTLDRKASPADGENLVVFRPLVLGFPVTSDMYFKARDFEKKVAKMFLAEVPYVKITKKQGVVVFNEKEADQDAIDDFLAQEHQLDKAAVRFSRLSDDETVKWFRGNRQSLEDVLRKKYGYRLAKQSSTDETTLLNIDDNYGPLELGGKKFVDFREAKNFFKRVLAQTPNGERVGEEDTRVVKALLDYHSNAQDKLRDFVGVSVDCHPEYPATRCFFVEKHGGDAEDFSYHKCLTLLYNQLRKG